MMENGLRMRRRCARGLAVSLLAMSFGAMMVTAPSCAPQSGQGPESAVLSGPVWIRTELYFGLEIPAGGAFPSGGHVSEELWQAFVDEEITPRFPDGLSVFKVQGQWRDGGPESGSSKIVHEESREVVIFRRGDAAGGSGPGAGTPSEEERIEAIRSAYKKRFNQDSVMRVESASRVRFE